MPDIGGALKLESRQTHLIFQAVGYSCLPSTRNKDGLVCINFKKKEAEIKANQQQVVDSLTKVMGNKPNMAICVETVKALPDDE